MDMTMKLRGLGDLPGWSLSLDADGSWHWDTNSESSGTGNSELPD